jgi:hypothetical protein
LASKGAREDLVAAESDILGNQSHGSASSQKLVRGTLEAQPQRVLLWCLTEKFAKGAMQVKRGPSGAVGQRLQVPRPHEQILNDAQEIVLAHWHILDAAGSDT